MARGAAVDYIALVHAFLAAVQGRINDPLAKWRVGAEARRVAAAYAAWDAAMVGVAREVLKATPPEYTIAGARAVGCEFGGFACAGGCRIVLGSVVGGQERVPADACLRAFSGVEEG
jgi:hypothetical protein